MTLALMADRAPAVASPLRVVASLLVAVCCMAGVLVGADVAVASTEMVPRSPAVAAAQPSQPPRADHVIVVGAPGLMWQDVSARTTPTLARLARTGSVGAMSARAVPAVSCPVEGWLTLGAGTPATAYHPDDIDDDLGCGPRQPPTVRGAKPDSSGATAGFVTEFARLSTLNQTLRYDAQPGLLGDAMACTSALGPGAALAAADSTGRVDNYLTRPPEDPEAFLSRCPLTVVDAGALPDGSTARQEALRELDEVLTRIDAAKPADTAIVVVGVSQTQATQARLGVAVVSGDGFAGGWLRSPGTRRPPYVQLIDVAPTIAGLLDREPAQTPAGRAWHGEAPGRPDGLGQTRTELIDADRQAVIQQQSQAPFLVVLGALCVAVMLGLGVLLYVCGGRRSSDDGASADAPSTGDRPWGSTAPRWAVHALAAAAAGIAAVPVMISLLNLVPWWRWSHPLLLSWSVALAGAGVLVALVYAARYVAGYIAGYTARRGGTRPVPAASYAWFTVVGVCGLTVVVFTADALTENWLQLGSLLGYNPLIAGRFTGFGNPGFALFGVAAMFLAAFLAHGHRRWVAAAIVATVAVPVTAVEGLPQWGADAGGILTLLPAFVVLGLLVSRTEVTWQRLGLGALAGAVVFGVAGWLDYLRPEDSRTHFGSFFGSLLDGTAWSAIRRKLLSNVEVLLLGPHTVVALLLAVALVVAVFRPPALLRQAYRSVPALRAALIATSIVAGLGFATNDSGIIIPAVLMLIAGPLTLVACAQGALEPERQVTADDGG